MTSDSRLLPLLVVLAVIVGIATGVWAFTRLGGG
jgi:hypothetical protein